MSAIKELAGRELLWIRPARQFAFELRGGDEVIGHLRWERSSLAAGDMAGQKWTFKRVGFLQTRVTVRAPGSNENSAVFHPSWTGGGTLDLGPGRQLRFSPANFWRTRYDWIDAPDIPLVHFQGHGLHAWESRVEIEQSAVASREVPLLVVLGWYLLVLWMLDAEVSGG